MPGGASKGANGPTRQDLKYRDEIIEESREAEREQRRYESKQQRKLEKERFEELQPRAEAGTKERQLEKKRDKAEANRSFREARSPGAEDVGEGDLMGNDEGVEGYKAKLKQNERRKTERELRKEEILRARATEREERLQHHRAKEDETMNMLKAIAKERFG